MTSARKMEMATLLPLPLGEDASLLDHVKELRPLTDLVLPDAPREALDRVLAENFRGADLQARGLRPANRLLFQGPPGCGKTVAAGGLAYADRRRKQGTVTTAVLEWGDDLQSDDQLDLFTNARVRAALEAQGVSFRDSM